MRMGNLLEISRIENLLDEYGIGEKLNELTAQIKIDSTYDIFPQQTQDGIRSLQNSELSTFDSHKFFDNVSGMLYQTRASKH